MFNLTNLKIPCENLTVVILFDEEKYVPYQLQQYHIPDEFELKKPILLKLSEILQILMKSYSICWETLYTGSYLVEGMQMEIFPILMILCFFCSKEAERTRNIGYQYGHVVELHVDGHANKVLLEYQNSNEVVKRKTTMSKILI